MKRRDFIALLGSAAIPIAARAQQSGFPAVAVRKSEAVVARAWSNVKVGAGGQLPGLDIAPDGTKVIHADTAGAFIWDKALTPPQWRQLITTKTMPPGYFAPPDNQNPNHLLGVWQVRIAYSTTSNPSGTTLYMINGFGFLFRSTDSGRRWTVLTGFRQLNSATTHNPEFSVNGDSKFINQKMIVDPANPDIVYISRPSGIDYTLHGTSASPGFESISIATIPPPTFDPGQNMWTAHQWSGGLAFDPSGGTINVSGQTRTKNIYLTSFAHGVYFSGDGGQTWQQIANGISSPSKITTGQIDPRGVYVCNDAATGLWMWRSGNWSLLLAPGAMPNGTAWGGQIGVAADPNSAGRIVIGCSWWWNFFETLDYGAHWVSGSWQNNDHHQQIATDIRWLEACDGGVTGDGYTVGDLKFDPSTTPSTLYLAEGIGVWKSQWPTTWSLATFTSQSLGIENMVAEDCVAPNGRPICSFMDRAVFAPDLVNYPATYGPIHSAFNHGWALDYASSDPTFVCLRAYSYNSKRTPNNQSGYTTNGGASWTLFNGAPATNEPGAQPGFHGAIAAATPQNIVMVPGGMPHYTLDGGKHWYAPASLPQTGWARLINSVRCHMIAADRVNYGTFYGVNYADNMFYRSTDGGVTWKGTRFTTYSGGYNCRLRAAPGHAGHVWYTDGQCGHNPPPHPEAFFYFSADAGSTWTTISRSKYKSKGYANHVLEVFDFGFGAPKGGIYTYPSIWIAGWVDGVWGIYLSYDQAQSWQLVDQYANDNPDMINVVCGDLARYGRVYIGFSGSGFAYGDFPL